MSKTANVRGKGFRTILTVERSHFFNIVLKFSIFLFGAKKFRFLSFDNSSQSRVLEKNVIKIKIIFFMIYFIL
jgi:hypothetical protein